MNFLSSLYDNVLTFQERKRVYDSFFLEEKNIPSSWISKNNIQNHEELFKLSKLIDINLDTSECSGYEFWTHNLTSPGYHYDRDEFLFREKSVNVFPMCTLIYYLEILNYDGNIFNSKITLSTPDFIISPKENRCVIMNSGIIHGSSAINDIRRLLVLSPWKERPSKIDEIVFYKENI